MATREMAQIEPFRLHDELTGHIIEVRVSPYYSIPSVDERHYYFKRETGEFDGDSFTPKEV